MEGASLDLDAQSMVLYILSRNVPAALLSTAAIPFVGQDGKDMERLILLLDLRFGSVKKLYIMNWLFTGTWK